MVRVGEGRLRRPIRQAPTIAVAIVPTAPKASRLRATKVSPERDVERCRLGAGFHRESVPDGVLP